ncbi:hypothetical protein [Roseofilum casamattae]|uniref:Uncharacterized protein n=1 Tax=Roseofilum casamattae BLCC-M143 TaxID=3022442 RepID=A0ABT7BR05_9CYAN|nr:hypothetical protein [Roseofilum casamattae]MDJ1181623.1 hypothetical protein [Roseofilum casamattae BLCC-M143]
MPSSSAPEQRSPQEAISSSARAIAPLLLSASTLPVLLGILALKHLSQLGQDTGRQSEEIFRGDRLPLLTTPDDRSFQNEGP